MRSKVWIPILAAVLVLCVAATIAFTRIDLTPDDIASTTPPDTGTPPPSDTGISPPPENIPTIDDAALIALLQEAETITNASPTVTLNNNRYVSYFLICNRIELQDGSPLQDETITIAVNAPNQQKDLVRFVVFLSLLTERYAGYYTDSDYEYQPTFGRERFCDLFLCSDFKAAGYDTALDYLKAIRSGTCPPPKNAYYIQYQFVAIRRYGTQDNIYAALTELAR